MNNLSDFITVTRKKKNNISDQKNGKDIYNKKKYPCESKCDYCGYNNCDCNNSFKKSENKSNYSSYKKYENTSNSFGYNKKIDNSSYYNKKLSKITRADTKCEEKHNEKFNEKNNENNTKKYIFIGLRKNLGNSIKELNDGLLNFIKDIATKVGNDIIKQYSEWSIEYHGIFWADIISHNCYEILEHPILIKELENYCAKISKNNDRYRLLNYVLWYKCNTFNLSRMLKTLECVQRFDNDQFNKNKDGEMAIQTLNMLVNNGKITKEDKEILYFKLMECTENIEKTVTGIFNRFSSNENIEVHNALCWIATRDLKLFTEKLIRGTFASLPISAQTMNVYTVIKEKCQYILKVLERGNIEHIDFDAFFKKYKWNSKKIISEFKNYTYEICSYENELKYKKMLNKEVYGASLAEICDKNILKIFLIESINRNEYDIFRVCFAHSLYIDNDILDLLSKQPNLDKNIKIVLLNTIEKNQQLHNLNYLWLKNGIDLKTENNEKKVDEKCKSEEMDDGEKIYYKLYDSNLKSLELTEPKYKIFMDKDVNFEEDDIYGIFLNAFMRLYGDTVIDKFITKMKSNLEKYDRNFKFEINEKLKKNYDNGIISDICIDNTHFEKVYNKCIEFLSN